MKTLKLFNAVLAKPSNEKPFISEDGFVIEPNALWAKEKILSFYKKEKLSGNDLNKTFHKSWKKIKDSSRFELLIEQILHYLSTYGSNFQSEIYIPDEVLNVPDVKVVFKVIKGYAKEELIEKSLGLLKSGVALKEETINDIITVLTDEFGYKFTGKEGIKNKEAVIKIADMFGVVPQDTMEFFRYVVYRSTGKSLLIKNYSAIEAIKSSNYNPSVQFQKFGLERLAEIFNRFKPIFLAYKGKCPKVINKISKLSKEFHKPMVTNPLNLVTSRLLTVEDIHWLNNATPFALFKAVSACYSRMKGQDSFVYRIRNGKSWIQESVSTHVNENNLKFLLDYMKGRFNFEGKSFYFPEYVKYALPTSEKMFVGNIPTGTSFSAKKLAVGVYWQNDWGARDIDVHGLNLDGHIGWNSDYNQKGHLLYSGDITNAPNGAVEYLYAGNGLNYPTLVQMNVYSGSDTCGYKIVVGAGDKMSCEYMMNPNNLLMEVKCESVQRQNTIGLFLPNKKGGQTFVILNFGSGSKMVSSNSKLEKISNNALQQQWETSYSFDELIFMLGGSIETTREGVDYDFSLDTLEKDSFTKIFK